jgi:hypothetical protein
VQFALYVWSSRCVSTIGDSAAIAAGISARKEPSTSGVLNSVRPATITQPGLMDSTVMSTRPRSRILISRPCSAA